MSMSATLLKEWFQKEQRDFPWRKERSPYVVLVSEIMLQQTRAVVVLPYFLSWMEKFPDFPTLARAKEEDIIKAWEGLGYYSRARNLQSIAKKVVDDFDGIFPSDYDDILSFKGIGPYTAAAISHFAFGKKAVGADGNIKKVIARFYGYQDRIDRGSGLLELLDTFLGEKSDPHVFEGLIELGATLCSKKPKCELCPLQDNCIANIENLTDKIPLVKKREKIIPLHRFVFLIIKGDEVLIKKEDRKLMNGLHEFPYLEREEGESENAAKIRMEKEFSCSLEYKESFGEVSHSFTKYRATLFPILCFFSDGTALSSGYKFVNLSKLENYSFSSGHRKIIDSFLLEAPFITLATKI